METKNGNGNTEYCKSSAIYALTNAGVFVSAQIVALLIFIEGAPNL